MLIRLKDVSHLIFIQLEADLSAQRRGGVLTVYFIYIYKNVITIFYIQLDSTIFNLYRSLFYLSIRFWAGHFQSLNKILDFDA